METVRILTMLAACVVMNVTAVSAEWHGTTYFEGKFIRDIAVDGRGDVWVSVNCSGYHLSDDGVFERIKSDDGTDLNPRSFHVDTEGDLWIASDAIWEYDGTQWTRHLDEGYYVQCIETVPDGRIWAGTIDSGLFYFNGDIWKQYTVNDGLPDNKIMSIAIDDEGLAWIGTFSTVLTSFDGESFNALNTAAGLDNLEVISMFSDSQNRLWVSTNQGLLLRENGAWSHIDTGTLITGPIRTPHDFAEGPDGCIYTAFGTSIDIFPAPVESGGVQIIDPYDGYSMRNFPHETELDSEVTYAVAFDHQGNFWRGSRTGLTCYRMKTSVEQEHDTTPSLLSLNENTPNPFNPSTSIRFTLAEPSPIELTVFDITGRKVATLIDNTPLAAGEHETVFDGAGLASGVYVYRCHAGDMVKCGRMTLVK